jgi:hypothetical protein
MQRILSILFGEIVRPLVIVACVVVLGIEASMHNQVSNVLYTLDIVFVVYFLFEMLYRAIATSDWKAQSKEIQFWFWFDGFVTLACTLSLFAPFIDHPSLLGVFRILRVLRLFRLFSIFPGIRSIERKILGTLETVVLFGFFSLLIVYVYAVVGMNLFSFQHIGNMNFENLYEAMISMFVLITNDWADAWRTTRLQFHDTPTLIIDLYYFSFIGFAVIFTLNVFLAVMTSQIEQRFSREINNRVKDFESDIETIRVEEQKDNIQIEALSKEIKEIKELLKNSGPNN